LREVRVSTECFAHKRAPSREKGSAQESRVKIFEGKALKMLTGLLPSLNHTLLKSISGLSRLSDLRECAAREVFFEREEMMRWMRLMKQ
jgi:hypothetical protein